MVKTPTTQDTNTRRGQAWLYEVGKTYPHLGECCAVVSKQIRVAGFNRERLYFFKDKHGTISLVPQELSLSPRVSAPSLSGEKTNIFEHQKNSDLTTS